MGENRYLSLSQFFLYAGLAGGLLLIGYTALHSSLSLSILLSILPIMLTGFLFLLKYPYAGLLLLFIVNYFIMGVTRYIPELLGGIVIDALVGVILLGIFAALFKKKLHWEYLRNGLTVVVSIWFLFCILNILNPLAPIQAWIIGIRRTALYFFFLPIFTFLLFNRYKDLKLIIQIWSVFVLLAVSKALMQKYIGFDVGEQRFLYAEGKATTHIIYSGIRYFSFFTDAANFGCGMAFALVFFSILSLFAKTKFSKAYYIIVSILAGYGMLISGTRVAIVIPFAGFALFSILARNVKIITGGAILLAGLFIFLNFSNIGQGNTYIRRMRTVLHPEQDASFLLRVKNQQIMRTYMADKPFGVGIGTAKAAEFSRSEISKIPTDSWLVMVWVETGIIGAILYIGIILYILIKSSYIVMFKVKDRELQAILGAFLAAIFGIFVASYANEVVAQFPNGPIIYMAMAFIFMYEQFDRQIKEQNQANVTANERTT